MKRRFFFRNIALGAAGFYVLPAFTNTGDNFAGQLTDDMEKLFGNPPDSCKPWVMWYWMNGHVTKEGITLDLEMLKRAGFRGAFCFRDDSGIPSGPVKPGSQAWLDVMTHAIREAERLGLELVFEHLSDYSEENDTLIPPEYKRQKLVWSEMVIPVNRKVKVKLPEPVQKPGYYRDIAVLAFPAQVKENQMYADPDSVVDITSFVNSKGWLKWETAVTGNQTIVRIGHTLAGKEPGMDFFRKEAMDWLFGNVSANPDQSLTGQSLKGFFGLTLHSDPGVWSIGFDQAFSNRLKYSLKPWLLVLTGKVVGNASESDRFLKDFGLIQQELFAENFEKRWMDWCHLKGLMWYTIPFEVFDMESLSSGGLPAVRDFTGTGAGKETIAVISASPPIGDSPGDLKFSSDVLYSMGNSDLIISPFVHQPYLTGVPGMSTTFSGMALGRNNTWSEGLSGLTNYLARTQLLMRQGSTEDDFIYSSGSQDADIRFSHRRSGDAHIYYLFNSRNRTERINCSFRINNLKPEIWNCETGEMVPAPIYSIKNDRLRMPLEIPSTGAVFIIFRKKFELALFKKITKDGNVIMDNEPLKFKGPTRFAEVTDQSSQNVPAIDSDFPLSFHTYQDGSLKGLFRQNGVYNFLTSNESAEENIKVYAENCFSVPLDSSWVIHFPDGSGTPREITPDKLESLTRHSDFNIRHFSGSCTYSTLFYLTDSDFISGRKFLLDLGRVEITARISMNGTDAGLLWKKPFIADITALVKTGENILKVEVTNSWHNRTIGDESLLPENEYNKDGTIVKLPEWYINNQPKPGERKTFMVRKCVSKDDPLVDSGLLGPVRLIFCEERFL
jgi:hypothetical protein